MILVWVDMNFQELIWTDISNVFNFLLLYHIQYEDLLSSKKKSESNNFLFFVSGMCASSLRRSHPKKA